MKSMSICSILSLQTVHMNGELIHKLKRAHIKNKETVKQYGDQRKRTPNCMLGTLLLIHLNR